MESSMLLFPLIGVASLYLVNRLRIRLQLSKAKHPSLAGHSKMSRKVAKLIPFYEYDERTFFRSDDAPEDIAQRRHQAFMHLSSLYQTRFAETLRLSKEVEEAISDVQFTSVYRVPFQFSHLVRQHLKAGNLVASSSGVTVTDMDGNQYYDLAGSYGVNVFGYDVYKQCIDKGADHVRDLGPVLGAYHPVIRYNVERLRDISGMEEISFHMSGTEAVMQAVRLARYHTKRSHLVRFCGAYHGWWGDVQPGIGNPTPVNDTYTLKEMDDDTLRVLRTRKDIACVLVNPLQALHPNGGAPGDSSLVESSRKAGYSKAAYIEWLKKLRQVCTERNIVLIFDEVFLGFRLALGGAQEYFGIKADMVTYGKTLGGGLPIGVVCGPHRLMKRYRDDCPTDICFARGTFNSHPYVMGAMYEFLHYLDTEEARSRYQDMDQRWDSRAALFNQRLSEAGIPVQVANMTSIWTVLYTQPSRYNWMLQYYLRLEGLALSWVGTGRFIFSLNYSDADFEEVIQRFIRAALQMQQDGWWWSHPLLTNQSIKRRVLREMLQAKFS